MESSIGFAASVVEHHKNSTTNNGSKSNLFGQVLPAAGSIEAQKYPDWLKILMENKFGRGK
jgi:hypothetical protein